MCLSTHTFVYTIRTQQVMYMCTRATVLVCQQWPVYIMSTLHFSLHICHGNWRHIFANLCFVSWHVVWWCILFQCIALIVAVKVCYFYWTQAKLWWQGFSREQMDKGRHSPCQFRDTCRSAVILTLPCVMRVDNKQCSDDKHITLNDRETVRWAQTVQVLAYQLCHWSHHERKLI